jgi:hypothetical protein
VQKLNIIKSAIEMKDANALGKALCELEDKNGIVSELNEILLEDWHCEHEDIVFELGLIGESSSTDAILKAASINFKYLIEWGNNHEFQRKCAFALARIGTQESKDALEKLSFESDPYLQKYGNEGLQKWLLK